MSMPKHILVLNSGVRIQKPTVGWAGEYRLHFMELYRSDQLYKLQGMVFHDVVWVRPLSWDNPDREHIEETLRVRMIKDERS